MQVQYSRVLEHAAIRVIIVLMICVAVAIDDSLQ